MSGIFVCDAMRWLCPFFRGANVAGACKEKEGEKEIVYVLYKIGLITTQIVAQDFFVLLFKVDLKKKNEKDCVSNSTV